jgi:REP element-mobilizing transposase RayT
MSQSLSKVYVHITFSTKNHQPLINDVIKTSLFEYLGGICKGMECNPLKVGGHRDHVHILCLLSRKVPQMKLLEEIKKQSSKCPPAGRAGIKTKGPAYSGFYWQDGYGIFSVNPIETDIVVKYIENQQKHHKKLTFKDEFRTFLKKYNVEYDERYVWD